ncbi:MAG: phosphatidylcholine/phosphatidylserine synthase [Chlamydiota bacterium]|nr:phosphatidylcholine/phosphatidylserine synthase [Chlamydiota bacterium]
MKKIYLLPNIITAFGLTCGLFVIFKMNMTAIGDVTPYVLLVTTGILILAAFADLLDGAIARAMKAESEFGGLFDSLADAITFGVAPAVIVLKTLSIEPGTESSFLMTGAAMMYTVCGVLRLIRYNVTNSKPSEKVDVITVNNKNFTGLPIPAAAGAIVSLNLFIAACPFSWLCELSDFTRTTLLFSAFFLAGYLMISRWRFPSLKTLRIRVASFQMVFVTVVLAVFIFYGILHHFPLVLFTICWGYIAVSLMLTLIRMTTGKKSKTLADFDLGPDSISDD